MDNVFIERLWRSLEARGRLSRRPCQMVAGRHEGLADTTTATLTRRSAIAPQWRFGARAPSAQAADMMDNARALSAAHGHNSGRQTCLQRDIRSSEGSVKN
jgi:hypothetical protein